jgi:hypothetical protein
MSVRLVEFVDRTPVRIALLCVALGATLLFAPWAVFGTFVGFDAYVNAATADAAQHQRLFWAGLGGILGLAGTWVRLFYRANQLAVAPALRYFAAGALGLGAITAAALLVDTGGDMASPRFWVYAVAALLAATLCVATVQPATPAP